MSFKPKNANSTGGNGNGQNYNFPVPKAGSRRARVSLIVDLGTQERAPFNEGKADEKPQKPCQQVAVFADLVADTVDYGGDIGKAHYRLMLNGSFGGVLKGINFMASPPKDADGNTIPNKPWGFHPKNMLSVVAKAIGKPEVIESMDISELLNGQFMADVEVNEKDSGKLDKDGEPIIYRNVNFKGASKVAPVMKDTGDVDENGDPIEVEEIPVFAALKHEPKCITFTNATKEDIKFIRANLIKVIKLSSDYAGSQMQKAIEAFEAENGGSDDGDAPAEKPAAKPAAKKPAVEKKKPVVQDTPDDDIPF